jgi:hypothetical protein
MQYSRKARTQRVTCFSKLYMQYNSKSKICIFKVERIKLRILRGKVIPSAAFRVASTGLSKHRKCVRKYLQEQQCVPIHCMDALNAV